jgi:hypothetical protein
MITLYRPVAIMALLGILAVIGWSQPVVAAPQVVQTPGFSSAPVGGDLLEFSEPLSTTSAQMCARTTVALTRTAADVLAIGAACTATDRCFLRFQSESQAVAAGTTTVTFSTGGASDDGRVFVYAKRVSATSYTIYVGHDLPTATLTCAGSPGCTVVAGITSFPPDVLPIGTWTITNGAVIAGTGVAYNGASTCWVDMLTLTNKTAGAITVTAADVRGTPLDFLTAVSIAANTSYVISFPGGLKFEGGLTLVASADDSINVKIRAIKVR